MIQERYNQLTNSDEKLTTEEIEEGWHFCNSEWDGMLIHKSWPEFEVCTCIEKSLDIESTGFASDVIEKYINN